MPSKAHKTDAPATLRSRAERRLGKSETSRDDSETRRIVHELEVHQIELEIQNADLRIARDEAETLLTRYTDLYDLAPVGYFTLSNRGSIRLANLTGAEMVGIERSKLKRRSFRMLLSPPDRKPFKDFLRKVFACDDKQAAEFQLADQRLAIQAINIEAWRSADGLESSLMVRDLTARKLAENSARQNLELNQEIHRRKLVEINLRTQRKEQSRILRQTRIQQGILRDFSHRILQAQEEERKRISRELHDVIAQTLLSINMHLDLLAQGTEAIPKSLRIQMAKTQSLVERAVNIVHDFASQLRPTMLDDLGLIPALQMFVKESMTHSGIHVSLETGPGVDQSPTALRTTLYRIAQEALTNVARHANATRVDIHIVNTGKLIRMTIKDNGDGFQTPSKPGSKNKNHLGLIGMKERTQMIGGDFSISSKPGGPTTVQVSIPVSRT